MVGAHWRSQTAADLYEFISTQMPADAPGTRTASEYLQVMAFLLSKNGYQPGDTPLPSEPAELATMSLAQP
jgi:hypothetical protein